VGAQVSPLAREEWTALVQTAGLKDLVVSIHPVDVQGETKGILQRYGCLGMLRVLSRTAFLYRKSPAYRQFVKRVRQGGIIPENLNEHFGYGLYVGSKYVRC
jgi:hypothetical protein